MGKLVEGTVPRNSGREFDSFELEDKFCMFSDHQTSDLTRHNNPEDFSFDENENDHNNSTKRTVFWESQEALLQEILERYMSVNIKLRQGIENVIEEAKNTDFCLCEKPKSDDGCINCLRKTVVNLLCQNGYNAKLCVSKWKSTKEIPGGVHEFIQVSTQGRKKQIPVLIELELRDQFKILKACNEYQNLVNQLPDYYIGKFDYLNAILCVLCEAAKQSMKEKKLHRGPWRKRKFMEMKWSGFSDGGSTDCSSESDDKDRRSCLEVSAAPAVAVI